MRYLAERIFGVEVGSTAPVFLAVLVVHVAAALTVVFGTATVLAAMRWREDYHLFLIGTVAFGAAMVGYVARRRQWPGDAAHIVGMGVSYVAMLTAFYVDNGKSLPVWNRLPTAAYWIIPGLVGAPLIMRATLRRRHPDRVS